MANIFKFLGENTTYIIVGVVAIAVCIGASFLYKYLSKKLEEKKEKENKDK